MELVFTKHWQTVGPDVCDAVLHILNSDGMRSDLNSTFIALIPKKSDVDSIVDFRPISLCNVIYKLVSKTISLID